MYAVYIEKLSRLLIYLLNKIIIVISLIDSFSFGRKHFPNSFTAMFISKKKKKKKEYMFTDHLLYISRYR